MWCAKRLYITAPFISWGFQLLRNTFVHIPGVGYSTERELWKRGVRSWDDFLEKEERIPFPESRRVAIRRGVEFSARKLDEEDHRFFASGLPYREHWRAYAEFEPRTVCLDIETTGLSAEHNDITMIGLFDGRRFRSFLRHDNLEDFGDVVNRYSVIVTYNGSRFDLPFIMRKFPEVEFHHIHIDLMYPLWRLGQKGGLKAIERRLGISRSEETEHLTGYDAVRLWKQYEKGSTEALELLIEYNREDVVNLMKLMKFAYENLRASCLGEEFRTAEEILRCRAKSEE